MAVDMFMKLEGVKGEARDKTHQDEIDVLAWSWGMTQAGTTHMGGGGGSGKVDVHDLRFTKFVDLSSTDLMIACCDGKHFDKATLTVRKAGENPLEYLTIKMEEVIITSISTGGSGGKVAAYQERGEKFKPIKLWAPSDENHPMAGRVFIMDGQHRFVAACILKIKIDVEYKNYGIAGFTGGWINTKHEDTKPAKETLREQIAANQSKWS